MFICDILGGFIWVLLTFIGNFNQVFSCGSKSYVKIVQGNITLERISALVSCASEEICEVWEVCLECENCTFTFR